MKPVGAGSCLWLMECSRAESVSCVSRVRAILDHALVLGALAQTSSGPYPPLCTPGSSILPSLFCMTSIHIQLWGLGQVPFPPLPSTQLPPGLGMLSLPPLPGLLQQPSGVGQRSASWVHSQGCPPAFAPRPGCASECPAPQLSRCAPHGSIFTW